MTMLNHLDDDEFRHGWKLINKKNNNVKIIKLRLLFH